MSEFLSDSLSAPFDHQAVAARQQALLNDSWRLKPIPVPDFTGKIVSRQTAEAMFGNRNADPNAPIQERVSRIILMLPYARGLPDGPGIWCDSVLKQIRSLARDIGQCDSVRYPQQRVHLVAKYDALVIDTEMQLENAIRFHLGADLKPFLNHAAALNFRVGGGGLQQPSRREIDKAIVWSAAAFVGKLIAWGVTIRRNAETAGLAFSGAATLLPADREILNDHTRMAAIELYLGNHPELCEPADDAPPAPIAQIVQIEKEPAEVEAIPVAAEETEGTVTPAEPDLMTETVEPIAADDEPAEAVVTEAVANPTVQPRRRRHRFA